MRTLHLGPEELLVAAKIAVLEGDTGRGIAEAIDAAEVRARDAAPGLTLLMYLEPDIARADSARTSWQGLPAEDGHEHVDPKR